MIEPAIPKNERERVARLQALGVLDSERDDWLDRLIAEVATNWDAPIAAISLVDSERQWFKAQTGLAVDETPRSVSFCAHLLNERDGQLIVEDAQADPRFCGNPLVTGDPGIRFYAGAAVRDLDGHILGAVCVIDNRPRIAEAAAMDSLAAVARIVSDALVCSGTQKSLLSGLDRDQLTGLRNLRGLETAWQEQANKQQQAMLIIDVSGMRRINDSLGYAAGNAVLVEVAARLAAQIGRCDYLARIRGDTFASLIAGEPRAIRLAAERMVLAMREAFEIEATPLAMDCTAGIAVAAADDCFELLLARADSALAEAKHARDRGEADHSPRIALRAASAKQGAGPQRIERALRQFLERPDAPFDFNFQAIFDLSARTATSVEALVRWSIDGQSVSPADFVPLAENRGLAPALDMHVLRTVTAIAAQFRMDDPALQPLRLMINLSAHSLTLPGLERRIADLCATAGLPLSQFVIELTESALATNPASVGRTICALDEAGIAVALDDFGSGQTSLMQLQRYPIRRLKLDRSLVRGASETERGRTVLRAIASLGEALGMDVVAEGIETEAELEFVAELGCGFAQGYLLARPVPSMRLASAIAEGEERLAWARLASA